jgi:hypothetical protein
MGIYIEEKDFCAPVFAGIEDGSKVFFSNKIISVPMINDEDKLMFTI